MHQEQRERTHQLLKAREIERALFANFASVKWLTGFNPPIQLGASVFQGGPPLLWYEDGHWTLIVLDAHAANALPFSEEPNCSVVSYLGYTIEQPIASAEHLANALREVVKPMQAHTGKVGVEELDVPEFIWNVLRTGWHPGSPLSASEDARAGGGVERVAIDHWLAPLRMIKTNEELKKLRDNFALTDIGHAAARRAVAVRGAPREIDVWIAAHSAIERAAGQRVPLGNDCIVGHRQANSGGWPTELMIEPDDSVIVDLSTLLHGYWSDSCATYYANEPTARQREMHTTAAHALEFARSLIRPGAVAREIDARVRQFIADAGYPVYPHHTGHGVGVTGHEAPRIVPYSDEVLQAGMVIMLEPGIYFPGETGVRLEDAFLVTFDGAEVLTHHDKSMP